MPGLTPEEVEKAHRWFAVECNNGAWGLTAKQQRTPAEDREMLLAAHAAAYHWSKVGSAVNHARGDVLLAHVHALLDQGSEARRYAEKALHQFHQGGGEDWDLAFAHSEMALAGAKLGDRELHAKHYVLAEAQGRIIKDDEDRKVFFDEFARIPKPRA
jgi:hypothetical protein